MVDLTHNHEKKVNIIDLIAIIKAIVPRSFEKTFDGIEAQHIATAFKYCVEGLTRHQINHGIMVIKEQGYCPDPAMFRKWCTGNIGFQQQFKGKHAALNTILKWLENPKVQLTNAEYQAYDECRELFIALNYSTNTQRAQYLAYEAFKDSYQHLTQQMLKQGVSEEKIITAKRLETVKKPKPHQAIPCPAYLKQQLGY